MSVGSLVTSALICVSTIPLPTHTSDIYSLSLSHMSAHHMVTHGTGRMCVQLGRGDEWGYTLHMPSSCVVFTVLREISNGTIYLPNIFASYILLSLPARYMQGKSKIKVWSIRFCLPWYEMYRKNYGGKKDNKFLGFFFFFTLLVHVYKYSLCPIFIDLCLEMADIFL